MGTTAMTAAREPKASRPYMPGYGVPASEEGLLPWSWAEERLSRSHNYWLATARPDGRPHAAAVWGVWLEGAFFFSCATNSVKARNLASDPRCVVTTERADEAVIVEGLAEEITDADVLARFKKVYDKKYAWDMDVSRGGIYLVRPAVAFGFIEAAAQFAKTATRWTFD
jgi:hypothetical protein